MVLLFTYQVRIHFGLASSKCSNYSYKRRIQRSQGAALLRGNTVILSAVIFIFLKNFGVSYAFFQKYYNQLFLQNTRKPCILSTVLYIFLRLEFAAIQFCQSSFSQHISKQGFGYTHLKADGRVTNSIVGRQQLLTYYYNMSRFTASSPGRPKETANLKSSS